MTERTIDEKRRLVAEKIMGWSASGIGRGWWRPDQIVAQAMMVAESLRKLGWRTTLTSVPSWNNELTPHEFEAVWLGLSESEYENEMVPYGRLHEMMAARLEQAIFPVAVRIAERMEKDG